MIIKGKFVTLRAIEQEDLEFLREMMNDPDLERLLVGWSLPISKLEQQQWFDATLKNRDSIRLVIESPENGAIGLIVVTNLDWKNRSARLGIKIANQKYRAKGIGSDTLMAIMRFLFTELQMHYLDAEIIAYNETALKQQQKCGWRIEGIKRKAVYKGGTYHDLYITGILKEEYDQLVHSSKYWET